MYGLLIVHVAVTWFMVGLIWMIQTVHYPLYAAVGTDVFPQYEREHMRRMGGLLIVPATLEIVTAAVLVGVRPEGVPIWLVLVAGVLLAAIWIMTALVQAPIHRRLSSGFDPSLVENLIHSNWWRTAAWSLRGGLVAAMLLI